MSPEHVVPLSQQAVEVFRVSETVSGRHRLLFQVERRDGSHMSNITIWAELKRMGYSGKMTGHGFTDVASTPLREMGLVAKHIDIQLVRLERNQVSAPFNYAEYLSQRKTMMQSWADFLDKCIKR